MFEPLRAAKSELDQLNQLFDDPSRAASVERVSQVLVATAQHIAETPAAQGERGDLMRLYRGFLAASRVVNHLKDAAEVRRSGFRG